MRGVHEALPPGVDEDGALAAERLGDEEVGRVLLGEHRRVELHVLEVDQARADAVGHRDPVAHAPRLVRRVQEDLPEAAVARTVFFATIADGLAVSVSRT
jgi:hypothetical protein